MLSRRPLQTGDHFVGHAYAIKMVFKVFRNSEVGVYDGIILPTKYPTFDLKQNITGHKIEQDTDNRSNTCIK